MHSNFITPPDYVETVLVHNATQEQITALSSIVKLSNKPYNIYFYNDSMDVTDWLDRVTDIADVIIQADLTDPLEYFNK